MSQEEKATPRGADRRVHLVLSAGGVKCISYAGAIAALIENGFEFASVSGTSAGSLIGAILCSDVGLEGFKKAVHDLNFSTYGEASWWPTMVTPLMKPYAMFKKSRVAEAFRNIVGGDPKFKDLQTPFATFGVDLLSHKIHVYSKQATPEMPVAEALRISTAAPFMFPNQVEGENLLLDGAIISQSPVWLATVYEDELPIIVLRPDKDMTRTAPDGVGEYLTSLIDLGGGSRDYYLIKEMPRALLINIPVGNVKYDALDLSQEKRTSLIRSGRIAVEDRLKDLQAICRGIPQPLPPIEHSDGKGAAERGGDEAMRTLITALPKTVKRDQVFISYCREDSEWLHKLLKTLDPFTWNRSLNLWSDTKIPAGANWEKEINKALATAKVAVLLVTADYLHSEFVKTSELPKFLEASRQRQLTLLWVLVGTCGYEETPLATYNAVNNLEKPLNTLSEIEQEAELLKICKVISRALVSEPPEV